jgi:hypothetical protein
MRSVDVQVLHKFTNQEAAQGYLNSNSLNKDVVSELAPLLEKARH